MVVVFIVICIGGAVDLRNMCDSFCEMSQIHVLIVLYNNNYLDLNYILDRI